MNILVVGGIFREVLNGDTSPRLRYGGSGLTASVTAARLGAQVALASYVGGEDEEAVRAELQFAGVDDSAVLAVPGTSGTFVFPTRQDRNRPWPMYRPAESLPCEVPKVPKADIVVAFGIPDCDPVSLGWLGAGRNYETVIWDRQGWLSRAQDAKAILKVSAGRRIYLANELEAIEDASAKSLSDALLTQPPSDFDVAVIKRGDVGVVVVEAEGNAPSPTIVPAFSVRASSTIGTGDVFAGALAARLALGEPVVTAAAYGCAAAAVSLRTNHNLLTSEAYKQVCTLMAV